MFIKAIPTRYAGTQFRSRLEARWAAFFDLCGWSWDYEPIDLDGWCPDFLLTFPQATVYAEVKPVEAGMNMVQEGSFAKAIAHWTNAQVLLLGIGPQAVPTYGIGTLMDVPPAATHHWEDLHTNLRLRSPIALWRQAGNAVQWRSPSKKRAPAPRRASR